MEQTRGRGFCRWCRKAVVFERQADFTWAMTLRGKPHDWEKCRLAVAKAERKREQQLGARA